MSRQSYSMTFRFLSHMQNTELAGPITKVLTLARRIKFSIAVGKLCSYRINNVKQKCV